MFFLRPSFFNFLSQRFIVDVKSGIEGGGWTVWEVGGPNPATFCGVLCVLSPPFHFQSSKNRPSFYRRRPPPALHCFRLVYYLQYTSCYRLPSDEPRVNRGI